MVCAFRGWNDAAAAASTALTTMASSLDSELVARVDPEEYFDFQAHPADDQHGGRPRPAASTGPRTT